MAEISDDRDRRRSEMTRTMSDSDDEMSDDWMSDSWMSDGSDGSV